MNKLSYELGKVAAEKFAIYARMHEEFANWLEENHPDLAKKHNFGTWPEIKNYPEFYKDVQGPYNKWLQGHESEQQKYWQDRYNKTKSLPPKLTWEQMRELDGPIMGTLGIPFGRSENIFSGMNPAEFHKFIQDQLGHIDQVRRIKDMYFPEGTKSLASKEEIAKRKESKYAGMGSSLEKMGPMADDFSDLLMMMYRQHQIKLRNQQNQLQTYQNQQPVMEHPLDNVEMYPKRNYKIGSKIRDMTKFAYELGKEVAGYSLKQADLDPQMKSTLLGSLAPILAPFGAQKGHGWESFGGSVAGGLLGSVGGNALAHLAHVNPTALSILLGAAGSGAGAYLGHGASEKSLGGLGGYKE